ncbi:MAG: rRNA maturation RNase YbeY [Candidatus Cloacimonetes bacterium]|nr:rRNA maturation RNase YbeY [Candidatus Cloacimonadota bacterium]
MPEISFSNDTEYSISEDLFLPLFSIVLTGEKLEENTGLSLTFVTSEKIRELNRRYRGKDEVTDVLSFTSEIKFVPFLGDIIIDISTANRQKGNKSLQEELEILFLHGLLHLLGYDHMSDSQKLVMQEKEKFYIELLRSKP